MRDLEASANGSRQAFLLICFERIKNNAHSGCLSLSLHCMRAEHHMNNPVSYLAVLTVHENVSETPMSKL